MDTMKKNGATSEENNDKTIDQYRQQNDNMSYT